MVMIVVQIGKSAVKYQSFEPVVNHQIFLLNAPDVYFVFILIVSLLYPVTSL